MGFLRDLRREFIARPDAYKAEILFKWPDTNIRRRSQVTIEQDEVAVLTHPRSHFSATWSTR